LVCKKLISKIFYHEPHEHHEIFVRVLSLFVFICVGSWLIFFSSSCTQQETTRTDFALGTVCSVTLFEEGQKSIYDEIFARIREIENLMSVNVADSDVNRINAAAGIEPVQVQEDTFKVIERAVYFAELSGGAFDPAIGPLVSLWDINGKPRVPSNEEINSVLPLVNWRNIELYARLKTVYLTQRGMNLDLGGIAKGYAADETAKIIKSHNIQRAKIDLGGNIIMIGAKHDKTPWKVGIQYPGKNRGEVIGVLQIPEKTVVTSGVYERNFENNGVFYHHLLSVKDGYPVKNGILSVTVIADVSMDADALSTAVFVLGYEKGLSLLNSYKEAQAVFVFDDKNLIALSSGDLTNVIAAPGVNFTPSKKKYSRQPEKSNNKN
jgi:FAD:protein FMN transferase